jgi:hypothetical protein
MPEIDTMFQSPGEPELRITLSYPQIAGNTNTIRLQLGDVRAADDILVRYDFDRDGWAITTDNGTETAFVPAWPDGFGGDDG